MVYYGTSTVARQILGNLHQIGFYDFVLPWIFAFALVYGLLSMTQLFNNNKTIYAILAMVVAFFVTNYTPYGTTLSLFFSNLFGQAVFVLAGILVIIMLLVIVLGDEWSNVFKKPLELVFSLIYSKKEGDDKGKNISGQHIVFGLMMLAIGAAILLSAAKFFGIELPRFSAPSARIDPQLMTTIIVFGMILVVVLAVSKGGNPSGNGKESSVG